MINDNKLNDLTIKYLSNTFNKFTKIFVLTRVICTGRTYDNAAFLVIFNVYFNSYKYSLS